jgi:hypothetical protein
MVGEIGSALLNETTMSIGLKTIGAVLAICLMGIGAGNAEMVSVQQQSVPSPKTKNS